MIFNRSSAGNPIKGDSFWRVGSFWNVVVSVVVGGIELVAIAAEY